MTLEKNTISRERGDDMIVIVCGMIGAGKSTWSEKQNGIVSDFDEIGSKEKQIEFTIKNHVAGKTVYHVTCYPTRDEEPLIFEYGAKCIWINTTMNKCRKNILTRGRKRDLVDISVTLDKNDAIMSRYLNSDMDFEIIDVFKSNEKW